MKQKSQTSLSDNKSQYLPEVKSVVAIEVCFVISSLVAPVVTSVVKSKSSIKRWWRKKSGKNSTFWGGGLHIISN